MENHPLYSILIQRLAQSWQGLPDKPEETADLTLRVLWQTACGKLVSLREAQALPLPALEDGYQERLVDLVERRAQGQPLAYLTGRQEFMGIPFFVTPDTMIPRKETEILAALAVQTARELSEERGAIRVLDLCTGSGNVALTVAHAVPGCEVWGVDLTAETAAVALRNAHALGLDHRAAFLHGDLFEPLEGREFERSFDLITCNPPYISSPRVDALPEEIRMYEPRAAFDGGPFGVRVLTRLLKEAPAYLKPDSWLCFEVGLGQGPAMVKLAQKVLQSDELETRADEAGEIRAVRVLVH